MNFKAQAILGIKWTTFSAVFVSLSSIIRISILTRLLNKSDFGLMAIAIFLFGFTNLFVDLGITSAVLHKKHIKENELSSLYWMSFFISVILFLVIISLTPFIGNLYSENELIYILPIMGINLIVATLGKIFQTLEQKELNFRIISLVEIFSALISLILGVYLALLNFKVYSLVFSTLAGTVLSTIVFLFFGLQKYNIKFHFSLTEIKSFMRIGLYNTGGQIINFINKETDIFLIGIFYGIELLGVYSLAKQLVYKPILIINPILTKISIPIFSKMQNSDNNLKLNYLRLINMISSIGIPLYILIFIFSNQIVNLFYGNNFIDAVPFTKYLSIYMIFIMLRNPMGNLTIASGRTDLEFYWSLFTFIFMPSAIIVGSFFSINFVILLMIIVMVTLFIPMWKFVINQIISVNLQDYIKAHIPFYFLFSRDN